MDPEVKEYAQGEIGCLAWVMLIVMVVLFMSTTIMMKSKFDRLESLHPEIERVDK